MTGALDRRREPGDDLRVRPLRTGWLIDLESGVWAVDASQPVAVVLDPLTGVVRRVVSWQEVPPPGVTTGFPAVLGDGESLWIQHDTGGPVVRVGPGGVVAAGWVGGELSGQRLAACGPGVAWCTTPPPEDEFVRTGEAPAGFLGYGELRRIDGAGVVDTVVVGRGVLEVRSSPDGLLVAAVGDEYGRRAWDSGQDRISRGLRWYRIPWDVEPPEHLTDEFVLHDPVPPPRIPQMTFIHGHENFAGEPAVRAAGRLWFVEPSAERPRNGRLWERWTLFACDESRNVLASWDLGDGEVASTTSSAGRVVVAVGRFQRSSPAFRRDRVVDVEAFDARDGSRTNLLADGPFDVSEFCRPTGPRPVEADSFVRYETERVQDRTDRLRQAGAQDVRVEPTGEWPDTEVEVTMTVPERPGVRLRLRMPLFDELGRPLGPRYDDAQLADSLEVHFLPLAEHARDGFLDV